jgi:seryl-tRNA synthetase
LIASLKKELAEIRKTSSATITDSAKLQSQVAALTAEHDKLKEEHKATATSLTESQNESKALTAKLEAARKTNAAADKVPGSAVKKIEHGKTHGASAESVKENALKEELYRDLTGLIITSVKRKDGEDEYSCIQTGRNGSKLSFLLCLSGPLLTTNSSSTLPSHNRYRHRHHESKDAFRLELRRHGVCIRTSSRRQQRCRSDGYIA